MRPPLSAILIALLAFGCAHTGDRNEAKWERATAANLGISRNEVADMARAAVGERKLVVVLMEKDGAGGIQVYLAETMNSGHGIIVRFHRVGDRWTELDTGEIVKWVE